jgi:RNA polymerase-binding transcription factor DksA
MTMTGAELQRYRERLVALAERLQGRVTGLVNEACRQAGGEASGSLSNAPMHLADLGTDAFEQELSLRLLENEEDLLTLTHEAVRRIDDGTFGYCVVCEKKIPDERLQVVPYTPYCVGCASQMPE